MTSNANSNMKLWDAVKETAHSATKKATVNGHQITAINGTYMVQRATEAFGPIGKGWGYVIVEERFDNAGPIYPKRDDKAKNDQPLEPIGQHLIHTLRLKLWYMHEGERCEVEHFGHTPFVYRSSYGLSVDNDAPKKSLTDAMKKCLSMIGFSADVFLGEWDDREYAEAAKTKEDIRKAEDKGQKMLDERQKFLEWCEAEIKAYAMIPNRSALKTVYAKHCNHIQHQCSALGMNPENYLNRFNEEFTKANDALLQKQQSPKAS